MDFLSKLGIGGGIDVHLSVTPCMGIEMMITDGGHNIKSYAQLPLEYNETLREIASYDTFEDSVRAMFQMFNIDAKKTNVFLTLPMVWFGLKEGLPLLLDDVALTNVVLGELEANYIFKQKDATPYWFDALSQDPKARSVFYTAIQTEAIVEMKKIFTRIGANLVSIECNLMSTLKGLYSSGIATRVMNDENFMWNLVIVNNTGFQMVDMQGKKIQKFYEEPLPLKSYDNQEVYTQIESALQIAMMDSQSNAVILVSETDLVSAEVLVKSMNFGGQIAFVEDNSLKKEPLCDMSLNVLPQDQLKVSLAALSAIAPEDLLQTSINFLVASGQKVSKNDTIEIPLGATTIRLTPVKATMVSFIILLTVLGPIGLTYLGSNKYLEIKSNKDDELQQRISELDQQIESNKKSTQNTGFDPAQEIEKVLKNNRTKIIAYSALGESIPKNIYLTYFVTSDNGLIDIRGCADSVEDVYLFFKNMKDSLVESKLRLSKLDLKTESLDSVVNNTSSTIDNAPYVFEISNMNDRQLSLFMERLSKSRNGEAVSEDNGQAATENSEDEEGKKANGLQHLSNLIMNK